MVKNCVTRVTWKTYPLVSLLWEGDHKKGEKELASCKCQDIRNEQRCTSIHNGHTQTETPFDWGTVQSTSKVTTEKDELIKWNRQTRDEEIDLNFHDDDLEEVDINHAWDIEPTSDEECEKETDKETQFWIGFYKDLEDK